MNINDLLARVKQQTAGALAKDWNSPGSATSGINFYDLEAPAKLLIPVITPLRNMIPRVLGVGGTQANWKAVTAINTSNISAGVGFGKRGGKVTSTVVDYNAVYKALGLEDAVDFEADLAANGFQDVKALAVQLLLWDVMIQEEKILLGGNTSLALGTTPTATLVASGSGGTLATATYSVICVALTLDGYMNSTIAGGVPAQVSRTNADGTNSTYGGGSAKASTSATQAVTGPTGSLTAVVNAVNGAVAYAWYWGTAGNEVLGAITTINSVKIAANAVGTQNANTHTTDYSQNALVHDGLFPMCANPSYGGYVAQQANGVAGTGTPLTADTEGGVVEIDADLRYWWDNFRMSPDQIWVSSQEQLNITQKILVSASNSSQRFVISVEQGKLSGGQMVRSYMNKFSMQGAKDIPIVLHPNMPPGTILYTTSRLPYPLSNVSNILQVKARRDYYQIDWPLTTRSYGYGVYTDQVLQNYAPFAFGIRSNIANG